MPAHCTWIPALPGSARCAEQLNPQLLICVTTDGREPAADREGARQHGARCAAAGDRPEINESRDRRGPARSARATASRSSNPARSQAVCARELKAFRMERALNETLHSAQEYRKQLETVLRARNDAIAQVQEGILVEANHSWLDLIGAADRDGIVGQPIMDFFDEANQRRSRARWWPACRAAGTTIRCAPRCRPPTAARWRWSWCSRSASAMANPACA